MSLEVMMLQGGVSKRKDTLAWLLGTEFVMLLQKEIFRTHLGRDQESLLVEQSRDRKIVYSPDMGVGTSDKRCHECSNISGIHGEKLS
jgi:hypothetical protein